MQLKISDLFAAPDQYLFSLDGDQAVFLDMDRAAYRRSIFFDRRIAPASQRMLQLPVAQLADYRDRAVDAPPAIGWIFHVAHCGSTLLARALDRPTQTLVVREPMPLRQLAVETQATAGASPENWQARLRLATTMLDRRYQRQAPVIVKANVPVNFIVPEVMTLNPEAPAIFLYFTLADYLAAILRTDNHRRWVASITGEMRRGVEAQVGAIAGLDAPRLAAALWLAQIRIYADALAHYPHAVSLDAEALFDTPGEVLTAAFAHFGAPAEAVDIEVILASELFATYSKNPNHAFDSAMRRARQYALKRDLAGEIAVARRWVKERGLPLDRLANPLVGENPALL